jgi:hypothetical protein
MLHVIVCHLWAADVLEVRQVPGSYLGSGVVGAQHTSQQLRR